MNQNFRSMSGDSSASALFSLAGKLALVSGANRGIGRAIAEGLAAFGADVVGVSSRMSVDAPAIKAAIEARGAHFHAIQADFRDTADVERACSEALDLGRPIDILVNNAGIISRAPAESTSINDWNTMLQVDLTSQFLLTRELGKGMLLRGQGKIIFVASLLSFQGGINVVAYAAAKSGVAGMTRSLANEWAGRGVNVNAIVPGYIATDLSEPLRADSKRNGELVSRIPAGRWGEPSDLVGAAVYLASPASDYINGVLLPVDGGWLSR